MRVIFTCGGTAGHVNPALALAGYMREKEPDTAVLFVGTPTGMERELVAKAGYDYAAVEVSSFQRKLNAEASATTCTPCGCWPPPGGRHAPSCGISSPTWWWAPALRQLSHGEGGG